jgi:LppX_LprAFG lipoprotein
VLRRLTPALVAAGLLLAACGGGAPEQTDPKEIVTQGLEATAGLTSAHIVLTLDGTATLAELGGEMTLDGTKLEGDVDIANKEGHLTFAVPPLFGMTGEVIQIGEDSYVKTSMTGDTWAHSTVSEDDPMSGAVDPAEGLDELSAFLDKEGVEVEKLDDTACGDSTCYAVRLTIPAELLSDAAEGQSMNPAELVGESLVLDLYFDQEDQWLTGMSTQVSAESVGELTLSVTLSAFNEPVDVEAPPADEVTEGGGDMLPF